MSHLNILRRIRRRASSIGYPLTRFQKKFGDSEKGPEWSARPLRFTYLSVIVWQASGTKDIAEAMETCDEVIVAERTRRGRPSMVYGISWRGKWPKKLEQPGETP